MTDPTNQPETPPPPPSQPPGTGYPAPPPPPSQPPDATYPAPPPMPYAGQTPLPVAPRNGLGIAALVIAIFGLLLCLSIVAGVVLGIVAVILGFDNGGVATAGIVLGFLSIVAGLVFIPIYVFLFRETGFVDYYDCMTKAGDDQSAQQQCTDEFKHNVETKFSVTLTTAP